MTRLRAILIALILAALVVEPLGAVAHISQGGGVAALRMLGIDAPSHPGGEGNIKYLGVLGSLKALEGPEGYVSISYRVDGGWESSVIASPGLPAVPMLVKVIEVDGYIDASDVHVGVEVESFSIVDLPEPLAPAPEPLFYNGSNAELKYEPDPEVYSSDSYFPGKLVEYAVWHGLGGKSLIVVKFFPVNYNPVKGDIVVVDHAIVEVSYPPPLPLREQEDSVLILTSKQFLDAVQGLVELYRSLGYNVSIETVEHINETYKPAEPPPYPGYANPQYIDPVFIELSKNYDFNLSLKIIAFLRDKVKEYRYLVIVGNASTVPPSYYYAYPFRLLDPYNSWIPTDFFYASPDYDLAPDIYVGRIPFSDSEAVKAYAAKLEAWYDSEAYKRGTLYLSGGYPFRLPGMFGETALATMVYRNSTSNFYVNVLTRTLGNYSSASVKRIFSGTAEALWYFALSHGSGNALADLDLVNSSGLPTYRIEVLATSKDLLGMKYNPSVPIVSSVACMNGAWDDAIVDPSEWYFTPPSFGEAVLLSPAGGVAYIGSARVAAELFGAKGIFHVENGTLLADYYGATLLHEEILRAYNKLGPQGTTLGEVFAMGVSAYAAKTVMLFQSDKLTASIALSEALKASLLGDPAIRLPRLPTVKPPALRVSQIEAGNYSLLFNVTLLGHSGALSPAYGEMPLYSMPSIATLKINGLPGDYEFVQARILASYGMLSGYITLRSGKTTLPEGAFLSITHSRRASGLLLTEIYAAGWGLYRFVHGAIGVTASPTSQLAGAPLTVEAYGLDLLGLWSADLYVAGRMFASNAMIRNGYLNWTAALPYLAPGSYQVLVAPHGGYPRLPPEASKLLSTYLYIRERGPLTVVLGAPSIVEPGEVALTIMTLYKGAPVPAEISVLVTPNTSFTLENTTSGAYKMRLEGVKPGVYTIAVRAWYENSTLTAVGYTIASIDVISNAYNGLVVLYSSISNSTAMLTGKIRVLEGGLESVNTSLQARLGSIEGSLSDLVTGVRILNSTTALIKTKLGVLEGRITSIDGSIARIETSIGTLYVNLSKLIGESSANLSTTVSERAQAAETAAAKAERAAIAAAILSLAALAASSAAAFIARRH